MAHSHYDNLQVSQNASAQVIRAAYRTLASKYHPDKSEVPVAEANRIMKLLNEAYAVLTDPVRRQEHDEWLRRQSATPSPPREPRRAAPNPAPPSPSPSQPPVATRTVRSRGPFAWLALVAGVVALWTFLTLPSKSPSTPFAPFTPSSEATHAPTGMNRCKGSYEQEKCEELERKLAAETPGQRALRQATVEAQRSAAMVVVQGRRSATPTRPMPQGYVRAATGPNGRPWPTTASYLSQYPVFNSRGHGEVVIDNGQNDVDVYVKLVSTSGALTQPVRHIFIPSGATFTAKGVEPGEYDLRYKNLKTGSLYKTDSFALSEAQTESGVQYHTITMTLYKVRGGNMRTYPIIEDEFNEGSIPQSFNSTLR